MMKKCLPLVVLAFCLLPGCASIVSGTHQEIKISSEPAGATVIIGWEEEKDNVKTMAGRTVAAGVTPVTVSISRRDGMIEVVKEGYKAQTVKLERGFNYWFLGNVALTSPLSSMIDSTTGALNEYKPGEYMVKLEPVSK